MDIERRRRRILSRVVAAALVPGGLACEGAPSDAVSVAPVAEAVELPPAPIGKLEDEDLSRLEALGYLSGYVEPPERRNVTIHDRAKAYPGLNFYCSAHAPSCALVDMEGRTLHEWRRAIGEIWPGKRFAGVEHTGFWRRAYLYPNGDIVAISENIGIVWEFLNPNLVGERKELIAGIWERIRLDRTTPPEWARAASPARGG